LPSLAQEFSKPASSGVERLLAELQNVWIAVAGITNQLVLASKYLRQQQETPVVLSQTRNEYENITRLLIVEPAAQIASVRPIRRSIEAMREFDRDASTVAVRARVKIDTRFQSLLCDAALDICEAWRIRRSVGTEKEWLVWEARIAKRAKKADELMAAYRKWASVAAKKTGEARDKERQKRTELWWRRQTAVATMHEMEVAFRDLGILWLTSAENMIESLREEREAVLSLAEKMVQWLQEGADATTAVPVESMVLAAFNERLRSWSGLVEHEAEKLLPENAELIASLGRDRFRKMHPRAAFLSAFATYCAPAMRESVQDYWEVTAKTVREGGRAKEIVDYWRGLAAAHGDQSQALFDEARSNAAGTLSAQLLAPATSEALESKLSQAFWTWCEEGSTVLEAAQIGWLELLGKPRGRRLSRAFIREGRRHSKVSLQRAAHWGADQWERALETIGGKLPTRPPASPVVRRSTLRDTLSLPASKGELPAIYGTLFRLAPVEDRRFLVGRDRELAGLEQALADWEAGRFAACVFVGARGSGKTSLLNCAAGGAFAGREVIRTQFRERAITAEAIDQFLCQILGLPADGDLDEAFRAKRRILMIEEGERIYLRKVGGFDGSRHLMNWIQKTASTTLWVLAMNDKAFQALCAGAQFSRVFSQRINAMSVSRQDLENALLDRHRLSGLRLEFAPPPASDPRVSRIKNWLGIEGASQKLYFDSLYQQSGGVFRSAFELWLSSIERVEGETLKIRQPLDPVFARLRSELDQRDLFTLLVIKQHGSLTHEEVSDVLCEDIGAIRSRMDRLSALGLIEKDPEHSGLRVRPEAHRFTSVALRRVNLTEELE
jgi:AAA ATPase domain